MLSIWFDGFTAFAAMLAWQTRGFVRNDPDHFELPGGTPLVARPFIFGGFWLIALAILGIPYWFLLGFALALYHDAWSFVLASDWIVLAFLLVAVANVVEQFLRGYHRMTDEKIRLEFDWEFHMHLTRIAALMFFALLIKFGGLIAIALVLSYVEIYPMRALKFFGGDTTLDSENEERSPD